MGLVVGGMTCFRETSFSSAILGFVGGAADGLAVFVRAGLSSAGAEAGQDGGQQSQPESASAQILHVPRVKSMLLHAVRDWISELQKEFILGFLLVLEITMSIR